VLILDESADAKAGESSAGAARQRNGRLGKTDTCQVATCLAFYHPGTGLWTLVDGELFLPEQWFSPEYKELRQKLGIPAERSFQTKPQLGLAMIDRALRRGLPFERVAADEFYGRSRAFRAGLGPLPYALEVPANTQVVLSARATKRFPVMLLAQGHKTRWLRAQVRSAERGMLVAEFVVQRVWVPNSQDQLEELWLVIRRDSDGRLSYTLLNDPADTPPEVLIEASCQRRFIECVFEEAKSELGWDDFCAQKYLAWEHHTALTAAALWFIAGVKLQWSQSYRRDPQLNKAFQLMVLPALSTANVRELLQAVLPLPKLSVRQARHLVVKHLLNRAQSTKSRLKKQWENSS
jgi:SRSO17 transposase